MSESPNVHDAATVFGVLSRAQVNALLTRLDIRDAQLLLATVAQNKPLNPARIRYAAERLKEAMREINPSAIAELECDLPSRTGGRDFGFLFESSEPQRGELLAECSDQEVGIVLLHLSSNDASACAGLINADRHFNIIRCLARGDSPPDQMVGALNKALQHRLLEIRRLDAQANALDSQPILQVSKTVESIDFIEGLDDESVKQLLSNVNTGLWAPALKLATDQTLQRVMDNVAAPVAGILRQEIAAIEQVRSAESQAATERIFAFAKQANMIPNSESKKVA